MTIRFRRSSRMRIDRFNGNSLRRYHLPNGAIVVVRGHDRSIVVLPAWCHHISAPCGRTDAAKHILAARKGLREAVPAT